jgi:hypothetical protein
MTCALDDPENSIGNRLRLINFRSFFFPLLYVIHIDEAWIDMPEPSTVLQQRNEGSEFLVIDSIVSNVLAYSVRWNVLLYSLM